MVDKIDKCAYEDGTQDEREYRAVYEAGASRGLGNLAAHDWESYHLDIEKQMGLLDLSDKVFEEQKQQQETGLLATFLNTNLLGAFTGKKDAKANDVPSAEVSELSVMGVEVPSGLPKTVLRDAMLQWRMRHAAHPTERDSVDWLLGQLDPTQFQAEALAATELGLMS